MEGLSTPDKIIEAAKYLLTQNLVKNVSIRDVARQARVAHTTVIYYFIDRDLLLFSVFESIIHEDDKDVCSFVDLIEKYGRIWSRYPTLACAFNKSIGLDITKDKFFDLLRDSVMPEIKRLIPEGESVEFYYALFLSLIFHPLIANVDGVVTLPPEQFFENLKRLDFEKLKRYPLL